MSELNTGFEPDRLSDAAIACALNEDPEGIDVLMRGLGPAQMRAFAAQLAMGAADTLVQWAAESGLGPQEAAGIWRRGMLLRAQEHAGDSDGSGPGGDRPKGH